MTVQKFVDQDNNTVDGSGTSWKRSRRILRTRKGLDKGDNEQQRTRIIRSFKKSNITTFLFSFIISAKDVTVFESSRTTDIVENIQ